MDKNLLLKKFSKIFDIDSENMRLFFQDNKWSNYDDVLFEFQQIRNEVYTFLWNASKKESISLEMIEQLSKDFLLNKYEWMNEIGFDALKNYIFWISWHDGILKK